LKRTACKASSARGSVVIAGSYIGFLGIAFAFGLTLLVMVYAIGIGDSAKAQKYGDFLKEAGYGEGHAMPPITLSTTSDYLDLCEYIQHELMEKQMRELDIMKSSKSIDSETHERLQTLIRMHEEKQEETEAVLKKIWAE
jgi:hypothetical protein